VDLLQR